MAANYPRGVGEKARVCKPSGTVGPNIAKLASEKNISAEQTVKALGAAFASL
jgi:hypothetical protein